MPLPDWLPLKPSAGGKFRAFAVHVLTASGAAAALLAMMEAGREHWSMMFGWLGVALAIDAVDGTLARRLNVAGALPRWSGETLDLVVDFLTYVFVPAYAIAASRLLPPLLTLPLAAAIVVSAALYFADRAMKTGDHHFRGFPALWNVAAFYLFLIRPAPLPSALLVAALVILTFVPLRVIHPLRVARGRVFNLVAVTLWGVLAAWTLVRDFQVGPLVVIPLCALALYVLGVDSVARLLQRGKA